MEKNIVTTGIWYENATYGRWEINYSSILSKLIYNAGRFCDSFASDLFVLWTCLIERNLSNPEWKSQRILFGFRECGVDSGENNIEAKMKENWHFYRRVMELTITIKDDRIEMQLKQLA